MKTLKHISDTIYSESKSAYYIILIDLLFLSCCILGLTIDDRTLVGVNVWIKPLKFAISLAFYIGTLTFLMSFYPYSKLKRRIINIVVSWTLFIEMTIVMVQALRGVQSHYNQSNLLDGLLFAAMGILIAINVLIMILLAFDALRLRLNTTLSIKWSIVLGWTVVIIGSWVGGQMIGQMAHNVGVADGGPGLPVLNWSTIAGDLRVAHFFGLHGIQIIPGFAYLLSRRTSYGKWTQLSLVFGFAIIYASWIGYTFYQAKNGISFISL